MSSLLNLVVALLVEEAVEAKVVMEGKLGMTRPMYKEKDYFHPTNGNTGTCNVNANNVNANRVIAGNRASARALP